MQGHRVPRGQQLREGSQQVGHRDPPRASEQRLLEGFCRQARLSAASAATSVLSNEACSPLVFIL